MKYVYMQAMIALSLLLLACSPLHAAAEATAAPGNPQTGPLIEGMGPYYPIPGGYNLKPGIHYRAVMEVAEGPEDAAALNRGIESAARFLNMHAASGIAASDMELAVVLHGGAAIAALDNDAYRQRYQVDNPNHALLTALADAGVKIYLCGQSASFRGFAADEIHPTVTMALSAMTVLTRLQVEGWALLP